MSDLASVRIACLVGAGAVGLLACDLSYGGKCGEIPLGAPLSSLPVTSSYTPRAPGLPLPGRLVNGTACHCPDADAGDCDCTLSRIGSPYLRSACGGEGIRGEVLSCSVYSQDGGVLGVFAHCESYD